MMKLTMPFLLDHIRLLYKSIPVIFNCNSDYCDVQTEGRTGDCDEQRQFPPRLLQHCPVASLLGCCLCCTQWGHRGGHLPPVQQQIRQVLLIQDFTNSFNTIHKLAFFQKERRIHLVVWNRRIGTLWGLVLCRTHHCRSQRTQNRLADARRPCADGRNFFLRPGSRPKATPGFYPARSKVHILQSSIDQTSHLNVPPNSADAEPLIEERQQSAVRSGEVHLPKMSMKAKCQLVPRMARFIVPLSLVYVFEYFINQGLVSLLLLKLLKELRGWCEDLVPVWAHLLPRDLAGSSQPVPLVPSGLPAGSLHIQVLRQPHPHQFHLALGRLPSISLFTKPCPADDMSLYNPFAAHQCDNLHDGGYLFVHSIRLDRFYSSSLVTFDSYIYSIESSWHSASIREGMVAGAAYVNTFYRVAHEVMRNIWDCFCFLSIPNLTLSFTESARRESLCYGNHEPGR